jgi:2-methylisocitrate lyase-like PEP mutase family enzyme
MASQSHQVDKNNVMNVPSRPLSLGEKLKEYLQSTSEDPQPFIGVYDSFSASIAAKSYECIFLSGFGFSASFYGLPDIGFISWSDIAAYVTRIRTILPNHHILVDIDDGYCDIEVAAHVVSLLESAGASGIPFLESI